MRKNSVFKKLLTYLIGGTLFAITLSFMFKLSFINSTFKKNQDIYVQNVGKFSTPNLATFLWNVDNDAVKTMLLGLNQIYKIPKCEVYNEKGDLVAEIKSKEIESTLKTFSFDIQKDGKNMGKLVLYYNYVEANKNVYKFLSYELLMAFLIFSVLTIVAFVFIKNRVLWHLSLLMYKLKQIAKGEGDLRTRIDIVTKDELGEASRAFNFFVNRIESIIVRIKKTSSYINEMTEELTKRIYILSENLAQQSASFEEVSTSIQETAEHATQANQISKNSTSKINNISEDMIKTIAAIHDISKSSRKINDFINIITDIADQTNLLALNAAIEAARAGEHGKGFAIVADEVRKLAEKSASSAKEITSLISMSVDDVEKGIKTSEIANTNITEIFNDIQLMVEKVERISNSSSEQAAAMEENTSITSKMSEASNDLGKFSEELKIISNDLNELVEMFKTR